MPGEGEMCARRMAGSPRERDGAIVLRQPSPARLSGNRSGQRPIQAAGARRLIRACHSCTRDEQGGPWTGLAGREERGVDGTRHVGAPMPGNGIVTSKAEPTGFLTRCKAVVAKQYSLVPQGCGPWASPTFRVQKNLQVIRNLSVPLEFSLQTGAQNPPSASLTRLSCFGPRSPQAAGHFLLAAGCSAPAAIPEPHRPVNEVNAGYLWRCQETQSWPDSFARHQFFGCRWDGGRLLG